MLQTFDEDLLVHDNIGNARPIPWQDFCFDENEKTFTVDLYDKKKKKCGTLTFKAKFIYVKVAKPVNLTASTSLWKGMSATINLNNARTEGMRATINLKLQSHHKNSIQSRLFKLAKEEERAKKRITDANREAEFLQRIANDKKEAEIRKL